MTSKIKISRIITAFYLILLCSLLPLYMKEGYYMLGEAKGLVYMVISGTFALIMVIADRIESAIGSKKALAKAAFLNDFYKYILSFFLISNILTFIFSIDKNVAFWGLEGWRNGLLTVILMTFSFYVVSRDFFENGYLLAALLITPFFSYILGILNRFDIYPIEIYGQNMSFLATLGNINWFAGYLSIFVPIGIGLGYVQKSFSKGFFACALYEVMGLIALFTQGSDSALLVIAGTYLTLLFVSFKSRDSFKRFLLQLGALGLSMEITNLLILFNNGRYNYFDNLTLSVCLSHTGLILFSLSFFLYMLSTFFMTVNVSWKEKLYRWITAFLAIVCGIIVIALFIKEIDKNGLGNGRGVIWQISADLFLSLTPWQKLFGVGQDCFKAYAYNSPWTDSIINVFGTDVLTNAHCEALTLLIERGVVGAIAFYLPVFVIVKDLYKTAIKKEQAIICMLPVMAYLCNSLVSFMTPTSTPYFFILLGIGIKISLNQEPE